MRTRSQFVGGGSHKSHVGIISLNMSSVKTRPTACSEQCAEERRLYSDEIIGRAEGWTELFNHSNDNTAVLVLTTEGPEVPTCPLAMSNVAWV